LNTDWYYPKQLLNKAYLAYPKLVEYTNCMYQAWNK